MTITGASTLYEPCSKIHQEKIRENVFWKIRVKVKYYNFAFLTYLRYLVRKTCSKDLWGRDRRPWSLDEHSY